MPDRKFTLFHFSLIPIAQTTLSMRVNDSREEWLRFALKESFEFSHHGGATMHWVPLGEAEECIVGLVQRTRLHDAHRPPSEGGEEISTEEWQGAYVMIDPTHHNEGQRVAVENDEVGLPRALIKSLVKALNAMDGAPYQVEIEQLFDASRFWAFSSKHANVLRSINFDFIVPNMWDTEGDLDADLRATGRTTGAERVSVNFRSEHGVSTDNDRVREGVDYAEKGAGTLSARAMDGARFRSTKLPLISRIPAVKSGADAILKYFTDLKKVILGRGEDPAMDNPDRADGDSSDD